MKSLVVPVLAAARRPVSVSGVDRPKIIARFAESDSIWPTMNAAPGFSACRPSPAARYRTRPDVSVALTIPSGSRSTPPAASVDAPVAICSGVSP